MPMRRQITGLQAAADPQFFRGVLALADHVDTAHPKPVMRLLPTACDRNSPLP